MSVPPIAHSTSEIAIFTLAIVGGLLLIMFAPAMMRFQVRMLKWQIAMLEQEWAAWPARLVGAGFVGLGLFGLMLSF